MTETKHTPTPWKLHQVSYDTNPVFITDENYQTICDFYIPKNEETDHSFIPHKNDKANAEFIVRACNSHDDLVVALETCLKQMSLEDMIFPENAELGSAIQIAKTALAKAKGDNQ